MTLEKLSVLELGTSEFNASLVCSNLGAAMFYLLLRVSFCDKNGNK